MQSRVHLMRHRGYGMVLCYGATAAMAAAAAACCLLPVACCLRPDVNTKSTQLIVCRKMKLINNNKTQTMFDVNKASCSGATTGRLL